MYAGGQQQCPRVWQGSGRAGHAGRAPAPRHGPAKVLYVRSMFPEQLVFPWQPPLHILFPAPRCEAGPADVGKQNKS